LRSDWQVLIELSGNQKDLSDSLTSILADALDTNLIIDATVAVSQSQASAFWALRENISEAQRIDGISIKHDVAVPVSCIPKFIQRADEALRNAFPGLRIVCFGHIGDGNLHYNQSKAKTQENEEFIAQTEAVNRIVHDIVHDLGGSISAEHGLGQLKREEIKRYKSEVEMDLMRAVKNALDPQGLLNPNKVL
jgi:FAD/FMN-containing dehydrogenase